MLVIGLDAASNYSKFGYAIGDLRSGCVRIRRAGLVEARGQHNAFISVIAPELRAAKNALIAIDAPLGWPASLATELSNHRAGNAFSTKKDALFQRDTDRFVRDLVHKRPLEVGADKIARAAHSALAALQLLRDECGKDIPLAWDREFSGVAAIEVYPAGTLKARGLPHSGYKETEQLGVRRDIAAGVANALKGLAQYIDSSADVFDACLCLAAAKDFLDGITESPRNADLAKREGWIWVRTPSSKRQD